MAKTPGANFAGSYINGAAPERRWLLKIDFVNSSDAWFAQEPGLTIDGRTVDFWLVSVEPAGQSLSMGPDEHSQEYQSWSVQLLGDFVARYLDRDSPKFENVENRLAYIYAYSEDVGDRELVFAGEIGDSPSWDEQVVVLQITSGQRRVDEIELPRRTVTAVDYPRAPEKSIGVAEQIILGDKEKVPLILVDSGGWGQLTADITADQTSCVVHHPHDNGAATIFPGSASSTLASLLSASADSIALVSASSFRTKGGFVKIVSGSGTEFVQYTGKSGNTLTGCFRGRMSLADGTGDTPLAHAAGATVTHITPCIVEDEILIAQSAAETLATKDISTGTDITLSNLLRGCNATAPEAHDAGAYLYEWAPARTYLVAGHEVVEIGDLYIVPPDGRIQMVEYAYQTKSAADTSLVTGRTLSSVLIPAEILRMTRRMAAADEMSSSSGGGLADIQIDMDASDTSEDYASEWSNESNAYDGSDSTAATYSGIAQLVQIIPDSCLSIVDTSAEWANHANSYDEGLSDGPVSFARYTNAGGGIYREATFEVWRASASGYSDLAFVYVRPKIWVQAAGGGTELYIDFGDAGRLEFVSLAGYAGYQGAGHAAGTFAEFPRLRMTCANTITGATCDVYEVGYYAQYNARSKLKVRNTDSVAASIRAAVQSVYLVVRYSRTNAGTMYGRCSYGASQEYELPNPATTGDIYQARIDITDIPGVDWTLDATYQQWARVWSGARGGQWGFGNNFKVYEVRLDVEYSPVANMWLNEENAIDASETTYAEFTAQGDADLQYGAFLRCYQDDYFLYSGTIERVRIAVTQQNTLSDKLSVYWAPYGIDSTEEYGDLDEHQLTLGSAKTTEYVDITTEIGITGDPSSDWRLLRGTILVLAKGRTGETAKIYSASLDVLWTSSEDVPLSEAALLADVDGAKDDSSGTYTGTPSALIENPADVFYYLLRGVVSGAESVNATSKAAARAIYAAATVKVSGVLDDVMRFEDLRRKLGQQFMLTTWRDGTSWRLAVGRPSTASVGTITDADLLERPTFRRRPLTDLINDVRVRYDVQLWSERARQFVPFEPSVGLRPLGQLRANPHLNLTRRGIVDSEDSTTATNSRTAYRQTRVLEIVADLIGTKTTADWLRDQTISRWANLPVEVEVLVSISKWALELRDVVSLTLANVPTYLGTGWSAKAFEVVDAAQEGDDAMRFTLLEKLT